MRKIVIALLTGVVAVGAGLYLDLAIWRPLFVVAETLPLAEQALATPDLLVLAGLNAKQAVFLERWFMDAPAVAASPPSPPPAAGDRTLLDHLRAAKIDPRGGLDYVLYALYLSETRGLRQAIALIGRFDPAAVGAYLANELHAKPVATAGQPSYALTLTDSTTCQAASTWLVTVAPGWVLIADPASHAALASRFSHAPRGDDGEVAWWRELARSDVASIAIRRPDRLESAASIPFMEPAAKTIAPEVEAFQRAYLGLGIKAVPPEGQLRLVLDAKDASRAAEQIKAWQRAVGDSRDRWAGTMPTVARLYDGLTIRTQGARSTVDVTVNRATAARLQDVGNELVASVLGGFGVPAGSQPTSSGAEQLETNPPKFEPVASISGLGPYDPAAQFAEKIDVAAGPFGLRLDAIRLGGEAGLEVVVESFANAIPNIAAGPERAKLVIDSVMSTTGQELMKREDCGRERNNLPAAFTSALPPRIKASKTVRLVAGADARALQRIAGHVELHLPTRTETVAIAEPKAGTVVEKHGARVSINQVAGGSLSYQITGASDRVLLLRALNAKGQQLASHMKVSGDLLLGDGLAARNDYSGDISALEIVFAAEEQTTTFPFVLTNFSLAGEARPLARDDAPEFQPYSHQALRAQYSTDVPGRPGAWKPLPPLEKTQARLGAAQIEPFELSLDKVQPIYLLKLDFTLRGPEAPGFRRRFNLGELRLTRVALKDGSVLTPPARDGTAGSRQADRSAWSAPVRFMAAPKQGVLTTSPSFLIETKAKAQDLRSVEGSLSLQFPTALETLRLDDLSVGQTAGVGDLTITVAERSRQSLVLQTNQDGQRVVYVRLLDAQGQALPFSGPQITALPDGGSRFDLSPFNAPARAEIVIAKEMETETLPFSLSLP
jgi:hypothetical protein